MGLPLICTHIPAEMYTPSVDTSMTLVPVDHICMVLHDNDVQRSVSVATFCVEALLSARKE